MTVKDKLDLREERKDKIYDFLDSHKKQVHTAYSISNSLSLNLSTVQNLIDEMIKEGSLVSETITENNRLKKAIRIKKINEYNWQDVNKNDSRIEELIEKMHKKGLSVFIHQDDESVIEIPPPEKKADLKVTEALSQIKEKIQLFDEKEKFLFLESFANYILQSTPKYSRERLENLIQSIIKEFNYEFKNEDQKLFDLNLLINYSNVRWINKKLVNWEDKFFVANYLKNDLFKFLLARKIVDNYVDESDLLHPTSSYNQFFILDQQFLNYNSVKPEQLFLFLKKSLELYFDADVFIKFHENSLFLTCKNFTFNFYPIIKNEQDFDMIFFPSLKENRYTCFSQSFLPRYNLRDKMNKEMDTIIEFFTETKKTPLNYYYLKTLLYNYKNSDKSLREILKEERLKPVHNPYDEEVLIYPFSDSELTSNEEYIEEVILEL